MWVRKTSVLVLSSLPPERLRWGSPIFWPCFQSALRLPSVYKVQACWPLVWTELSLLRLCGIHGIWLYIMHVSQKLRATHLSKTTSCLDSESPPEEPLDFTSLSHWIWQTRTPQEKGSRGGHGHCQSAEAKDHCHLQRHWCCHPNINLLCPWLAPWSKSEPWKTTSVIHPALPVVFLRFKKRLQSRAASGLAGNHPLPPNILLRKPSRPPDSDDPIREKEKQRQLTIGYLVGGANLQTWVIKTIPIFSILVATLCCARSMAFVLCSRRPVGNRCWCQNGRVCIHCSPCST